MKTRKELQFMDPVPTRGDYCSFGLVTQHYISAHPLCEEATYEPARLMLECQAIADRFNHEVQFTDRSGTAFTFYPRYT